MKQTPHIAKRRKRPHVIHLSAECYPVAKVGGLGDVVGALPKYLQQQGFEAWVVMPWYNKPFVNTHDFDQVYRGSIQQGSRPLQVEVYREQHDTLGFGLFLVKIPGLLDRDDVYGYADESEQFMAFQHGFLQWIADEGIQPDVIHCHDHHTGLVPFLLYHCAQFSALKQIPTVGTVHNGEYQGWMGWNKAILLPSFDTWKWGLLDWDGMINPLAALIKCCWVYTAVSEGYLRQLAEQSNGLEQLFKLEQQKGVGIVNGIDATLWDPSADLMLYRNYGTADAQSGKKANKESLCRTFGLDASLPLLAYIGRFVGEKGADLLPPLIDQVLVDTDNGLSVVVLGSGDPAVETAIRQLAEKHSGRLGIHIGYQEQLAHQIYAASDFLIMPSRIEPCGLNQLYAMRYGTVPVVRSTGGLSDTVPDIDTEAGYGITFQQASSEDAALAIGRALRLYENKKQLQQLRKRIMGLDFSWARSTAKYIQIYEQIMH